MLEVVAGAGFKSPPLLNVCLGQNLPGHDEEQRGHDAELRKHPKSA